MYIFPKFLGSILSKPESVKIYQLMNQCPAHVNITFEFVNSKKRLDFRRSL